MLFQKTEDYAKTKTLSFRLLVTCEIHITKESCREIMFQSQSRIDFGNELLSRLVEHFG